MEALKSRFMCLLLEIFLKPLLLAVVGIGVAAATVSVVDEAERRVVQL